MVCVCAVCVCGVCVYGMCGVCGVYCIWCVYVVYVWRSEANFQKLLLSFELSNSRLAANSFTWLAISASWSILSIVESEESKSESQALLGTL